MDTKSHYLSAIIELIYFLVLLIICLFLGRVPPLALRQALSPAPSPRRSGRPVAKPHIVLYNIHNNHIPYIILIPVVKYQIIVLLIINN